MGKTFEISQLDQDPMLWLQFFEHFFKSNIINVLLSRLVGYSLIYVIREFLVFLGVLITFRSQGVDGGIPGQPESD